jgi:hypothetical protein
VGSAQFEPAHHAWRETGGAFEDYLSARTRRVEDSCSRPIIAPPGKFTPVASSPVPILGRIKVSQGSVTLFDSEDFRSDGRTTTRFHGTLSCDKFGP